MQQLQRQRVLQLLLLHVPLLLDETQRDLPHYIQEAHRYLMITETADRQRQAAQLIRTPLQGSRRSPRSIT